MEADLAFRGIDFRDFFRPKGGSSRLTLRRLAVLVRALPPESATVKALGGSGFSMLELLVMESGLSGPVNPRHPWHEAERADGKRRAELVKERRAHYAARRDGERQSTADSTDFTAPESRESTNTVNSPPTSNPT